MPRFIWMIIGWTALFLGALGAFLPLLPTVPFIILAAFCFAKSNPALERRLLEHPHFGPHIVRWRERRAISRKGKWAATAAFAFSIALALAFAAWPWWTIPCIAALITGTWIWTRPDE